MNEFIVPHLATHPGEVLKDELMARNISQKDLAAEIDMQQTMLNEIIKGKRPLSTDIAVLLESALDIPADFWMNYQVQYDLDKSRIKEKNIQKLQLIEQWKLLKQYVPVNCFGKSGYLKSNLAEDIAFIKQIYEANSLDALVIEYVSYKSNTFFKKSERLHVDERNLFGWSKLVMWLAKNKQVNRFDPDSFQKVKSALHSIFYRNSDVREQTKDVLALNGIKLIFLEKFDKTPVDGYSFWSNENPAIGLTLRHKRIDNFAFTVFHELGHVYIHMQKDQTTQFLDLEDPVTSSKSLEESEADIFAMNHLISKEQWDELRRSAPYNDNKIRSFAETHKINPAIILSRLLFEQKNYAVKTTIDRSLY